MPETREGKASAFIGPGSALHRYLATHPTVAAHTQILWRNWIFTASGVCGFSSQLSKQSKPIFPPISMHSTNVTTSQRERDRADASRPRATSSSSSAVCGRGLLLRDNSFIYTYIANTARWFLAIQCQPPWARGQKQILVYVYRSRPKATAPHQAM